MADAIMQGEPRLLTLPYEVLLRILEFVYPPWSLEIELRPNKLIEEYHPRAIVRAAPAPPNTAPLATCKSLSAVAKSVRINAFTGVVSSEAIAWMDCLAWILKMSRWIEIVPHVRRLILPNSKRDCGYSRGLIVQFPALERVELVETMGFSVFVEEIAGGSEEQLLGLPDDYFLGWAAVHLAEIPKVLPLPCSSDWLELLVHVHFHTGRGGRWLFILDVTFRVVPGYSIGVVDKILCPMIARD